MKKLVLVVLALGVLAVPSSASAQATRTWVSGVGDDVNPCSRTAPCKTWAGAISKTFTGGEINALDPGGYGAVTITKSITLDGGATFASSLASGVTGVVINVDDTDANDPQQRVVLRNLSLNGAGASGTVGTNTGVDGIRIDAARTVHVENVKIASFTSDAIDFTPVATATKNISLTLDNVDILESSGNGVTIRTANLTQQLNTLVRDSTITSTRGSVGVAGQTGIGISADTGAHVWLTGTTIFDNLIGLKTFASAGASGVIDEYCDNALLGNGDDKAVDRFVPNRLCPDSPVVHDTITTNTVTQSPAPPPVVVEKTVEKIVSVPAAAKCVVPELVGLSLAAAKRGLKSAHCAAGKVAKKRSRKSVGRVVKQGSKPGSSLAAGAKVNLTVGKR